MKDKIYSSVPVNKLAKMVVSKPEFEDDIKYNSVNQVHQDTPLPTVNIKVSNPAHDLTGKRFGNLVVQGAFMLINPKKERLWVVRCDCGKYELKRALILHYKSDKKCCGKCNKLRDKLEKADERARYQKDYDERIGYNLGDYKGKGRYKKYTSRPYTKQLKIGDVMYNSKGDKGTIAEVSSRSITFDRVVFKSREKVYLDVSEAEAEKRKEGDFRE